MTSISAPQRTFWQRRLQDPLFAALKQGVSPDKLALTIAVGTVCSMFPFLGFTTLLNLTVGLWLRMNQPILQALNYLLTPLHLIMILVYVRVGEWIWGATDERFSIPEMLRTFHDVSIGEFLQRFGWVGVHAFTAWVLSVPLIIVVLYYPLRPVMNKLSRLRPGKNS